ncbi:MAG: hypothetical protein M1508_10435 [Nitrospirae bacterium]|nr:hypothetical protein [Nitrospirota bacterium]MCL5421364.1 hypothetical protein [Nitrospirota bacterium]
MGLFGKLFGGGEKEYPALDPGSAGAQCLEKFRPQLEALVKKINDRYEAVPGQGAIYVFLGNPPGMFGIAWFVEGDVEEHNFKKLIQKKSLSQKKTDVLMQKLRTAYTEKEIEPRYSVQVAGKKVIVVPSDSFAASLYNILHFMDE